MNEKEWRNWKKHNTIPENIPAKPEVYYKDSGWCGYSFWLKNELKIYSELSTGFNIQISFFYSFS